MTRPTVAVVIPVRDGAGEIADCVEAVLAQTARPDELVVVDNGSSDGTAAVAAAAGAAVAHEPRPGSYAARNTGVAATTADIVVFTDADCLPEPHWLEELVTAFDDPDIGVGGGPVNPVQAASAAERWALERGVLDQATAFRHPFMPYFATANAAYRRSVLVAVGGFDAQLASGGDVDACWRVQAMTDYRLRFVPGAVVRHRHRVRVRPLLRQQLRYARGH